MRWGNLGGLLAAARDPVGRRHLLRVDHRRGDFRRDRGGDPAEAGGGRGVTARVRGRPAGGLEDRVEAGPRYTILRT